MEENPLWPPDILLASALNCWGESAKLRPNKALCATQGVLAMLVALQVILNLSFWQALVCALIGFGIIQLLKYTIGRPIVALERWLRQIIAGVPLSYRMQELVSVGDIKDEGKEKGTVR